MKMRIKKYFLPCFLLVIAVLFFGLPAPASADFEKVNNRELARANASLTGKPGAILCPDPEDANKELEVSECVAIPTEKELTTYEDSLSSVYEDYGYDWWKNLKVVEDVYHENPPVPSPVTVESGRDGDIVWVMIGLGSQEAELDSWDKNVIVDCCANGPCTYCQDQILGSLHLDGLKVKTNGSSFVTLYKYDRQMGIHVDIRDVTVDRIDLATFSWGDADGFGAYSDAGYVGLKDTSITDVIVNGSLSLSVAREDAAVNYNSVHVGIDSLDLSMATMDTTLVLGDKKDFSGTKHILGTLHMKNLEMKADGYLNIYKPADKDVATSLRFGLNVPSLTLNTLSWGDADGFGAYTDAGYIGLRNLDIKGLDIIGVVTVEKVCPPGGTDINHPVVVAGAVGIEFNNLKINMAYMSTDVALGSSKDNLNQVLGSVSLSRLSVDITGTVQISAH